MGNTKFLSLGKAAEVSGWSKPVLSRALKSGKMSGTKNDAGQWQIDPAELNRVFPAKHSLPVNVFGSETPKETPEISVLQAELEGKDAVIEELRARVDELSSITKMLAAPKKAQDKPLKLLGLIPIAWR